MARRSGMFWVCALLATVGGIYLIKHFTMYPDTGDEISWKAPPDDTKEEGTRNAVPLLAPREQPMANAVPLLQTKEQPMESAVPLLQTKEQQMESAKNLRWLVEKRPVDYKCGKKVRLPNYRSTDSWTYCADPAFLPTKPCLVYSFGVNWDFSFEDAMEKAGCEVMSYDPSMDTVAHRHSPSVMFQPVGLGHRDSDIFVPHKNNQVKKPTQWQIRTLKTLVEQNKHSERTIDILKFDIETYEWNVTRNMIDSGVLSQVKQLLLEWHIFPHLPRREQFLQLATVIQDLDKIGFRHFYKFAHGVNPNWEHFNLQSDMGYVNTNFTKKEKKK
ncbi:probable methyltransferase-like protein 24 [Littorina saxatilis]|uniref:Methyltransferase domain-containing protein n=1 Tax=Littorina saxatilis TaxID=31220 RepID=A0AAN9AKS5_9CAEN